MFRFEVPEEEHENVRAFLKKHAHEKVYRGAIGGGCVFSFMHTSIGTIATISCDICKARQDVSGSL